MVSNIWCVLHDKKIYGSCQDGGYSETSGFASRVSVLETIHQDYVTLARMRGISKKRIRYFYIMRNALIPVFTIFMLEVGYVLSGSVVIESLFSYPGIGQLLYNAVLSRDYPLMQYGFLVTSVTVILASWLTDLLYCKIDPRMVSVLEK